MSTWMLARNESFYLHDRKKRNLLTSLRCKYLFCNGATFAWLREKGWQSKTGKVHVREKEEKKGGRGFTSGGQHTWSSEKKYFIQDWTLLSARSHSDFKPSGSPAVHFWVLQARDTNWFLTHFLVSPLILGYFPADVAPARCAAVTSWGVGSLLLWTLSFNAPLHMWTDFNIYLQNKSAKNTNMMLVYLHGSGIKGNPCVARRCDVFGRVSSGQLGHVQ